MANRVIIVGDVHGMLSEIQALIAKVGLTKDDTLVSVGDLVDKGPDSAGVARYFREMREQGYNVVLVQGNHEEKHARYRKAVAKSGGRQPDMKNVAELATITAALSPEDIAFLDSALPFYRIPEHNAVVVHAGILPGFTDLDALDKGEQQKLLRVRYVTGKAQTKLTVELGFDGEVADADIALTGGQWSDYSVVKKVVRPKGDFIQLGQEGPNDPYWAEVYDGRFGHVYFGHEPFMPAQAPVDFPHASALDLGCVFGGRLCAAVLEVGQPRQSVTVPSSGRFADRHGEE